MIEASPPVPATAPAETDAAWRQIVRQLSAIDRPSRSGPSIVDDEVGLREMRITLGLAFAGEALLLAGAMQGLHKATATRSSTP